MMPLCHLQPREFLTVRRGSYRNRQGCKHAKTRPLLGQMYSEQGANIPSILYSKGASRQSSRRKSHEAIPQEVCASCEESPAIYNPISREFAKVACVQFQYMPASEAAFQAHINMRICVGV